MTPHEALDILSSVVATVNTNRQNTLHLIACENCLRDTDDLPAKPVVSVARRQEIGRASREVREQAEKRRESSNQQIFYPVAKVG